MHRSELSCCTLCTYQFCFLFYTRLYFFRISNSILIWIQVAFRQCYQMASQVKSSQSKKKFWLNVTGFLCYNTLKGNHHTHTYTRVVKNSAFRLRWTMNAWAWIDIPLESIDQENHVINKITVNMRMWSISNYSNINPVFPCKTKHRRSRFNRNAIKLPFIDAICDYVDLCISEL